MNKPESVLKNETHNIFKDFKIPARKPYQMLINKKKEFDV